jgi:hypothetical protein
VQSTRAKWMLRKLLTVRPVTVECEVVVSGRFG